MEITGCAALVTGGAGGLGEATVRRLVGAGVGVVIADLAVDKGEALAKELGPSADFVETDVTSEASVATALEQTRAFGPLRIAVSVHGGFGGGGRILKSDGTPHDLEEFRRVLDHYLVGTFNVSRLAAARIAESEPLGDGERGVIVNTASIAAYEATIGQIAYACAKGGVVAMTIAAARDLAVAGIRVMGIAPGTFATPAYGLPLEELDALWGPSIPFPRRMGLPEEYARLVEAICINSYLNGEVIRIDGALRFAPRSPR